MTESLETLRNELARLRGLGEAYYDHRGELHYFLPSARSAILQAMGIDTDSAAALQLAIDATNKLVAASAPAKFTDEHCFEPEILGKQKCWGLSVQLYTLRSATNWGMGDFADLKQLIQLAAPLGCDVVGLNPLHALLPAEPAHISPYSPSSRLFINPLYIAIAEVDEFAASNPLQAWLQQADVQAELMALRDADEVRYERVAKLKFHALQLLYQTFLAQHVGRGTTRAAAFEQFVKQGGEALQLHARFDALHAFFRHTQRLHAWLDWPAEYHNPSSAAVAAFVATHAAEINFYVYLQWLADEQLANAQSFARAQGMRIGLYADLAVGANRSGSEVWANQSLYVAAAAIGAPPDPLALSGQDWGIPPIDPSALRGQHFNPFAALVRANMQHVGALRIDHVMSLFRLWWVPRGFSAIDGVYVHYPLNELLDVVRQASNDARCLIIGEDLGTVPDEMRDAMARNHLYHYNVLLFEKQGGSFKAPSEYPRHGVATATTHDLPPLKAWWLGADIDLRERLNLYPHADTANQLRRERDYDRRALLHALHAADVWHWHADQPLPEFSLALSRAIHLFLGLSNAALVLVQMEDLIGMSEPVNVPGTHDEYPNWQRKLSESTHDVFKRITVRETLQALTKARAGLNPNA